MPAVPEIYQGYAEPLRRELLALRDLILSAATETDGVGQIEETLKWGQPSFLTSKPKSGSTIRMDAINENSYALYFICHTHLVESFKELYPDTFTYQGNRALVFETGQPLPVAELKHCIAMALTYHLKH